MPPTPDQQEIYVKIWAKAVDTQMHFNEMSVKSRQFGLAFVAAALGLAIALLGHGDEFSVPIVFLGISFQLEATVLIVLASVFALGAVRILDLKVYHRMLRGAVTFGEDFEEQYMKQIFTTEMGMTQAISHYSRHSDAGHSRGSNGRYMYSGSDRKNAEDKIRQFYNYSIWSLVAASAALFLITAHFHQASASHATPLSPSASSRPSNQGG